MSVWSKCGKFSGSIFVASAVYAQAPKNFDDNRYFTGAFDKPEQVMTYLKHAPKSRKKWAEELYAKAVRDTGRLKIGASWGSVAKSCFDSLSEYPTGKAYLLGIEGRLKNWAEARARIPPPEVDAGNMPIKYAVGNFESAIAVESYERSMPDDQRAKLVPYRDCLKRYLDTGKTESTCVPLQWAGIVTTKK